MILQLAECALAQTWELEEVSHSPKKHTGFEERIVRTELLGTFDIDFCAPSLLLVCRELTMCCLKGFEMMPRVYASTYPVLI